MDDNVQKTIASYEIKADEYIRNTDQLAYFPDLPAMLDMFVSMLSGKQVLDVAFGSGRDTLYLLEHGLEVQGIDLTQPFIDALRKKVDIPLYKMDMRRLAFEDNSFDGIWCCSSFLHLPRTDALPALKGFYRVLRPGGILYLDLKEGRGEKWVQSNNSNITKTPRFYTYYCLDEVHTLLKEANFQVKYTRKQSPPKDTRKDTWLNLLASKNINKNTL